MGSVGWRYPTLAVMLAAGLLLAWGAPAALAGQKAKVHKPCMNCHTEFKDQENLVAGELNSRSMKAKSMSITVGGEVEVIKFTDQTKVENIDKIKSLKKPIPVAVLFEQKGADRVATLVKAKPKIVVPEKQLIGVKELAKLVAMGPKKGKYTLIDSRPPIRYTEGHIPTSLAIPFPAMPKKMGMLPKDKSELVIFYCGGFR
jgi:hypothetical protein